MSKAEEISKRKGRRNRIRTATLQVVKTAGLLSVALVAPNVVGSLHKFGLISNTRQSESVARARKSLLRAGLLQLDKGFLRITDKGEKELRRLEGYAGLRDLSRKWDEKWRVIIFDIPEKKSMLRAKLRKSVESAGFAKLQNSVWVFPYDSEELIALLKADLRIGKQLLYMIVEYIEGDERLRKHFQLD